MAELSTAGAGAGGAACKAGATDFVGDWGAALVPGLVLDGLPGDWPETAGEPLPGAEGDWLAGYVFDGAVSPD